MAITIDPTSRRFILDSATLSARDIYVAWVDWVALSDNVKFPQAFRSTGGDDLGSGISIPPYYFLMNGWRVRPMEMSHTLTINGNLFVDGSGDPIVPTLGVFNVLVKTVVPVQAQGISTTGGSSTAPSAADIWAYNNRTLTSSGAGGGATLAEIEASTVLAKQTTLTALQNSINSLPDAVRTELSPELAHVLTLENNPGMTPTQATMLLELFRLAGLDPSRPLIVTPTQRTAGDINQNISSSSSETVVIRS